MVTIKFKINLPQDYGQQWLIPVSFAMAVRWVPETIFPHPIGFDTPLYYAMAKDYAHNGKLFPLLLFILGRMYLLGLDMSLVMKILPTLLYGFLAFSVYEFSIRKISGRIRDSIIISGMVILSHAALRISWDMHKLMLASSLLILGIALEGHDNRYLRVLQPLLIMLAVASHELIAAIAISYMVIKLVSKLLLRNRAKTNSYDLFVTFMITTSSLALFLIWYGLSGQLDRVYDWIQGIWASIPLSGIDYEVRNLHFFTLLFAPLIPFMVLGLKRNLFLLTWLAFTLLGSFSTLLIPTFMLGGVFPWRYALLAFFPISTMAGAGLTLLLDKVEMKKRVKTRYTVLMAAAVIVILNINSLFFLGIFNSPPYMEMAEVMPRNMASTSIPIWDIEPVITLSRLIRDDNAAVLVPGNFVGWVAYYSDAKVYGFTKPYQRFTTLEKGISFLKNEGANIYLIWWDDTTAKRLGCHPIAIQGNLRLYHCINEKAGQP